MSSDLVTYSLYLYLSNIYIFLDKGTRKAFQESIRQQFSREKFKVNGLFSYPFRYALLYIAFLRFSKCLPKPYYVPSIKLLLLSFYFYHKKLSFVLFVNERCSKI